MFADYVACWTPLDSIDEHGGPFRYGPVICTRGFDSFEEADLFVWEKSQQIPTELKRAEFTTLEKTYAMTPDSLLRERLNWKYRKQIVPNGLFISRKK